MGSAHASGPKISRPAKTAGLEMTAVGAMGGRPTGPIVEIMAELEAQDTECETLLLFVISKAAQRLRNFGFGACVRLKISRPAKPAGLEMTAVGVMCTIPAGPIMEIVAELEARDTECETSLLFVISKERKRLRTLGFGACVLPKDFSSGKKRRTRNDSNRGDERKTCRANYGDRGGVAVVAVRAQRPLPLSFRGSASD
ncbi:MAG: hypothetical protein ACE5IR_14080 [bacterium]